MCAPQNIFVKHTGGSIKHSETEDGQRSLRQYWWKFVVFKCVRIIWKQGLWKFKNINSKQTYSYEHHTPSNFKELDSAFKGMCKIYFKKYIENIIGYKSFLEISKKHI